MTESDEVATAFISELQLYAKTNSPHARSNLDLPLLSSISEVAAGTNSLAENIDAAVAEAAKRPDAAALATIFLPSGELWSTNLSGRQRQAAAQLGMSYDSFRRRRNGQPSPYDTLCSTLLEQLRSPKREPQAVPIEERSLTAMEPPTAASVPQAGGDRLEAYASPVTVGETTRVPRSAQTWRLLVAAALAVVAVTSIFLIWSPAGESPDDQAVDLSPECENALPEAEAESERIRHAIEVELERTGSQTCLRGELLEFADHFFFDFDDRTTNEGGALVRPAEDGGYSVVILAPGPWWSYSQVGTTSGTAAVDLAGYATGEIVPSHGGYTLVTDGEGYLHGEESFGRFYWIPAIAYAQWVEEGAENGKLGAPVSRPHLLDGVWRVDFENGALLQNPDGTITSIDLGDEFDLLPADSELVGKLLSARGFDHWFVDDELRRWWLPNESVHTCAGGELNLAAKDLPGGVIHQLPFAGVASCPLNVTGIYPMQGMVDTESYCRAQADWFDSVEEDGDERYCKGERAEPAKFELDDVCRWQYGPDAQLITQPEDEPYCRRTEPPTR